jgi:hypothetical protein
MDFQEILCHQAGVNQFGDISSHGPRVPKIGAYAALPLVMGRHVDKHPQTSQLLQDLLVDHRSAKCKDSRDRVFALQGLVTADE